jgi:pilus assembly protein CpaF
LAARRFIDEVIAECEERSLDGALPPLDDREHLARGVYDSAAGFGPLQWLLEDPTIEEICIKPASVRRVIHPAHG